MGEACSANGRKNLVRELEGNNHLKDMLRFEDNIKIYIREIGWGGCGMVSSGSIQGQVAGSCEHSNEPSDSIKSGIFLEKLSDYKPLKKDFSMKLIILVSYLITVVLAAM
jgi:hypothetical protein